MCRLHYLPRNSSTVCLNGRKNEFSPTDPGSVYYMVAWSLQYTLWWLEKHGEDISLCNGSAFLANHRFDVARLCGSQMPSETLPAAACIRRDLRARASDPAWARRAVGEGVRSCPRAGCREIRMSGSSVISFRSAERRSSWIGPPDPNRKCGGRSPQVIVAVAIPGTARKGRPSGEGPRPALGLNRGPPREYL
jgi:hypothetical protein